MSHHERPPEPAGPAETTLPLPAVEAGSDRPADSARPAVDQPTTALPLIDLLAPKQSDPSAMPPGAAASVPPAAAPPHAGQVLPAPGPTGPAGPLAGGPLAGGPLAGPAGPSAGPLAGQGSPAAGPVAGPMPPPRRSGPVGWPLVAAMAGAVLLLGLLGWLAVGSLPTKAQPTGTTAPTTSAVRVAGGYQFTQRATRADTDCAANSYGRVADFFRSTPCTGLQRYLFTSTVDGRPAVVSVAAVRMADDQTAAALKKLADTNGTGNVADLLRAGVQVPGLPDRLTEASYASTRTGSTVVIVEGDYADPALRVDDRLERISNAALQLGG